MASGGNGNPGGFGSFGSFGSGSGAGSGAGAGSGFMPPNFGGSNPTAFGYGLPFSPENAVAGLRGLFSSAAPFIQNIVGRIDEQMVEEAIRQSMGQTTTGTTAAPGAGTQSGQFKETVKVDKSANKYGLDIELGKDTKPESLKISRKDNVMTINVKTENVAEDGSSRLYQEYTKKITLPENVDLTKLESSLSPAGVLNIQAPFLPKPEAPKPASTSIPVIIEEDTME